MRLAHLHIPGLIPYSHSLRLQNAVLERYFKYKDALRSPTVADHDRAAARNGEGRSGERSNIPAYRARNEKFGEMCAWRPKDVNAVDAQQTRDAASTTTNTRHDRLRTSSLDSGNGNRTTTTSSTSSKPGPSFSFQNSLCAGAAPPDPVLLTFSTPPTYTVGRRHLLANPISPDQQSFLSSNGLATFHASPRGGLLTYHAPGQLTGYMIADLRRHGITARCWVKLLEESIMRTCGAWGVETGRTDDPGVWVLNSGDGRGEGHGQESMQREVRTRPQPIATDRKICAIGVQVSRGVTSHGIGLNVDDSPLPSSSTSFSSSLSSFASSSLDQEGLYDFTPAQLSSPSYDPSTRGYLSWGFSRIVACGLEGKSVTWLTKEMERSPLAATSPLTPKIETQGKTELSGNQAIEPSTASMQPLQPPTEEAVATILAREIMHGLNSMKGEGKETVDEIYRIQEADIHA